MAITFSQLGKQGRLANQLWQIAAVVGTAKKNETNYFLPKWQYENYFNLKECFLESLPKNPVYNEPHFHYAKIPPEKNLDLSGYFQSNKYWIEYDSEIRNLLNPIYHFDMEPGLCSIHVRRGDYINFQACHPLMSMNYYEKAMEASGCRKFLIFSDDIDWCKNKFIGNNFEFSDIKDPVIDLAMMAKMCESNIICNSSFSWWAAWLNNNPFKKVIAPNNWFGPALQHDTKDLFPTEWIKI